MIVADRPRVKKGHVARNRFSHWQRTGRPKQEFATYAEAKAAAERIQGEDLDAGRLLTFPKAYKCELGGHYHVGNTQ